MKIYVSGVSYRGACDPATSNVPTQEGWPAPEQIRVGKGSRFIYDGDADLALAIATHLEDLAGSFAYADDALTRAEGRAFSADALRIRSLLATRATMLEHMKRQEHHDTPLGARLRVGPADHVPSAPSGSVLLYLSMVDVHDSRAAEVVLDPEGIAWLRARLDEATR